jgi:hypothetical protein
VMSDLDGFLESKFRFENQDPGILIADARFWHAAAAGPALRFPWGGWSGKGGLASLAVLPGREPTEGWVGALLF